MATTANLISAPERPFRFLDLAAELRNSIYELALTHDPQHSPPLQASPALLCTCKQVYKEARDILYAESTLHVTVDCMATDFRQSSLTILGNGFDPTPWAKPPNLLELRDTFPRHLTEIGTLNCTVRLACGFDTVFKMEYDDFRGPNRFLYNLANSYQHGKLSIKLVTACQLVSKFTKQLDFFYPIAKFSKIVELHLSGFEANIEKEILSLRGNVEAKKVLRFDAAKDWHIKNSQEVFQHPENFKSFCKGTVSMVEGTKSDLLEFVESREGMVDYFDDDCMKADLDFLNSMLEWKLADQGELQ